MSFPFQKVCVTGGAGFIGSKLVHALVALGVDVVVIDDLSVGSRAALPREARLVQADVRDTDKVMSALAGCGLMFHLAARVAVRSSFEFVVEDTSVNVVGTASVLRAAQRSGSVKRFVLTSSMAVYADAPIGTLIDEQWATKPLSPYGISKLTAEALVHQLCAHAGMSSAVLRLFNTYGIGQQLSPYVGAITIFCNRIAQGQAPRIFGDGNQSRDFVHVQDVVQALLKAGAAECSGETFNVGTGVATSVNQVVVAIQAALGTSFRPEHIDTAPGELRCSVANVDKARQLVGYKPVHVFKDSVVEIARQLVGEQAVSTGAAR
jgi:UDP-glucose 4-epimerase